MQRDEIETLWQKESSHYAKDTKLETLGELLVTDYRMSEFSLYRNWCLQFYHRSNYRRSCRIYKTTK